MRIIERGIKTDNMTQQARCMCCETLIEFERREARFVSDQRDGAAMVVKCPVCEHEIWVSY